MSDETYAGGLPPAGWYPDPDTGPEARGGLRWWDGVAWSEHHSAVPLQAPARGPGALGPGFPLLATALVWLVAAQLAAYVVLAGLYIWGLAGPVDGAVPWDASPFAYDMVELVAGVVAGLPFFASIVLWCIWQHRLARATLPGSIRRSPGMHVGSWFIPVVLLWFPLQNMRDLWRVHIHTPLNGLLGLWWTGWILTNLTGTGIMKVIFGRVEMTFQGYNVLSLLDASLWIASCALAIVIIRRLTTAAVARQAEVSATERP